MRSAENGFTTYYNIGKWADGDNPGASAINNNWDIIDTQIHSASVLAQIALANSGALSNVAVPIIVSGSNNAITLRYDTGSFVIISGALSLTSSIAKTSGSFTGSFSGSFTGSVMGQSGSFTYISSSGDIYARTASLSYITSSNIQSISGSFSFLSSSNVSAQTGSFTYVTASQLQTNSGSFNYVSSSILRGNDVIGTTGSFNYLDVDELDLLGVKHSFTLNTDAENVDVTLTFSRTTGGDAIFTWNGSLVQLNKLFKPTDLAINRISQTEPTGSSVVAGFVWLDPTS